MRRFPSADEGSNNSRVLAVLVAVLLAGLPLSVWLDLRSISDATLKAQAGDLGAVINGVRSFYATSVVARVEASPDHTLVTDDYESHPGAIPIPATFSLQLARVIGEDQRDIEYRFVSDLPFRHRAPHVLSPFERSALAALRADRSRKQIARGEWSGLDHRVSIITPVVMGATCVACHNTHPDSPKRDWKIGDVRGIQEITISRPLAANLFAFRWLLVYFAFAGALGAGFIVLERRQAALIRAANDFLASISEKISRYLSPQIYRAIFSGRSDAAIHTERKKLTIFFSDIKDFTSTTERLQPEALTELLNDYFTEMSSIALAHGGTVDKFVGDAMLIFFGDPESQGIAEDAKAALRMAVAMQRRLRDIDVRLRSRGVEEPFAVRMGINTGYCNVGNFGSNDRMDYTIIGSEVNLASRLQSIAEAGQIVVSHETFSLVRDIASARALAPIAVKGFQAPVVPYVVDGLREDAGADRQVFAAHADGLDFYLDVAELDEAASERTRAVLQEAMRALERRSTNAG